MIYLPLSKSSWPEGRIGKEESQDYFKIVKLAIDLSNENKDDKILLLSNFKSKHSSISELDCMINICKKYNVNDDKLIIEENGYDTLSQLKFTFDLCKQKNEDLIIISSLTHYPRASWICRRLNKKYKINYKNKIGFGIPRFHDVLFDIPLMFLYPIIDLLGFSQNFSLTVKRRRSNGNL